MTPVPQNLPFENSQWHFKKYKEGKKNAKLRIPKRKDNFMYNPMYKVYYAKMYNLMYNA